MTYAIVNIPAEIARLPRRSRARAVLETIAYREMTERLIMARLEADIAAIVECDVAIDRDAQLAAMPWLADLDWRWTV